MKPPLIYSHFGNSSYLRFVLKRAVASLPDRQVILLGDRSNQWLACTGALHVDISRYQKGDYYNRLDKSFRLVGGEQWLKNVNLRKTMLSGMSTCWTRFNFSKWIYLHMYLASNGIHKCWFFDSDVLIVDSLDRYEQSNGLSDVDWTYWNSLHQQQGWIGCQLVVSRFIEFFLSVFEDKHFLASLENTVFRLHPGWGYTLMRAWDSFYAEKQFTAASIHEIGENNSLLFLVDPSRNEDSSLRQSDNLWGGRATIQLFYDSGSRIYSQRLETYSFQPAILLDLSWTDTELLRCLRYILNPVMPKRFRGLRSMDDLKATSMLQRCIMFLGNLKAKLLYRGNMDF